MLRRSRGFTLIELLVVIAIIAILAAILFPVFAAARNAARGSACISNLKQLGMSFQMYENTWNDRFPYALDTIDYFYPEIWGPTYAPDVQALRARPNMGGVLFNVLSPYVKNKKIWTCPSDKGAYYMVWGQNTYSYPEPALPSVAEKYGMSYAYQTRLGLSKVPYGRLRRPGTTLALADCAGYWHTRNSRTARSQNDNSDTATWSYNVMFCDGHVKNVDFGTYVKSWNSEQSPIF